MKVKSQRSMMIFLLVLSLILVGCDGERKEVGAVGELEEGGITQGESEELQAQRDQLEEQRREEAGEFYVPLPPIKGETVGKTVKAKALYVTANVAGMAFSEEDVAYYADYVRGLSGQSEKPIDPSRMDEINKLEKILGICESTEVNALVIDVKNDHGLVAWDSDIQLVEEIGSNWSILVKDRERLMGYLKEREIYTIARIVAFKDPYFPTVRGEHAIQLKAGGVYQDKRGVAWVNPFDEYVWKYVVAVSQEAALWGFDEIQYDYVRFPEGAGYYNPITDFPGREGRDKDQGIADFLKFAQRELEPYNVHVSADVFGIVTHTWDDKPDDIGQTWRMIANQVEYICPMIYPSHYGPNLYGYPVPDQEPYGVVRSALLEAIERNAAQKEPGIIRPWYQAFTASWVRGFIPYDGKAVADQIVAGADLGIEEYILWNASNNYDPMSFFYQDRVEQSTGQEGRDLLGRTPEEALHRYFEAEKKSRTSQIYLLTPLGERAADYDEFAAGIQESQIQLKNAEILTLKEEEGGNFVARVNGEYTSLKGVAKMKDAEFQVILEKEIYKVVKPKLEWVIN